MWHKAKSLELSFFPMLLILTAVAGQPASVLLSTLAAWWLGAWWMV